MKKLLLLTGTFALSVATMAQVAVQPKWDYTIERMFQAQTVTRSADSEAISVSIEVTDAETVMNCIKEAGYKSTFITESAITAVIPLSFVEQLANLEEVVCIYGPNQMQITMDKAREIGGVDNIHTNASNDFETPFTGKGVIVGIIDQGFQYRHAAFLDKDGKSRIISLWNRTENKEATSTIPNDGEKDNAGGHGTHVAGIAVGSKIEGLNYHGVAPEADIVMIPSTLKDAEVLEDVAYIKNLAKKQGKPYVINMSFGSHAGSHDGMSHYNRTLNELVADNSGVFVCAASNEGNDKLHTSHTFTKDGEVRYVMIDQTTTTQNYTHLHIWEQTGDGNEYITVEPCYELLGDVKTFNVIGSTSTTIKSRIDTYSKKQNFEVINMYSELQKEVQKEKICFGVKITGKKGATIHVWNNTGLGHIHVPTGVLSPGIFLNGDNAYLISDSGASAEKSITVASYNTGRYSWTSLAGKNISKTKSTAGTISSFSSRGPVLTPNTEKPTISAPGSWIVSSINRYSNSYNPNGYFDEGNTTVIASVKNGTDTHYYGVMQGTSMAAPFVSGVIALWYEANPKLTYDQIISIIQETAKRDMNTMSGGKNAWGAGKINAYDGLKMALKFASSDGINDMQNSEAPISFQKNNNAWRILFNNNESFASIRVTDLNGRIVAQQSLEQLKCGDETSVSLNSLPAGVYLINVATTKANITRKVMKN